MPILDSIMEHDLFGPVLKSGIARGREEGQRLAREDGQRLGREEGERLGREEGERLIIQRQIDKRFGPVPEWAKQRIEALSGSDVERIGLNLLDARSLEQLLG